MTRPSAGRFPNPGTRYGIKGLPAFLNDGQGALQKTNTTWTARMAADSPGSSSLHQDTRKRPICCLRLVAIPCN